MEVNHGVRSSPEFLESKTIAQIITISGNGKLLDGSEASVDLRELLSVVPSSRLVAYVSELLGHTSDQGGFALQDLVNEIGRRVGFDVEHGLYRGGRTKIGFDGIWRTEDGYSFVVEVKTTNAYQFDLDVQASYRSRLIEEGRISKEHSSILIVVGRDDTGGLEAQTRGSRHAWDIRIISVDALIRLLGIKEEVSEPSTVSKIHELLKPLEYTRVDRLIDFIFTTTEDLKSEETDSEAVGTDNSTDEPLTDFIVPAKFHEGCIRQVAMQLQIPLIKQGKSKFSSANQSTRVLCIVSKEYSKPTHLRYWFAFHPSQRDYLQSAKKGYVALGCGDMSRVFLFSVEEFLDFLPRMRTTVNSSRMYWHVEVFGTGDGHKLFNPGPTGLKIEDHRLRHFSD